MRYLVPALLLLGGCATERINSNDLFYGNDPKPVGQVSLNASARVIPCIDELSNCGKVPR